jgi:hypothetical protein
MEASGEQLASGRTEWVKWNSALHLGNLFSRQPKQPLRTEAGQAAAIYNEGGRLGDLCVFRSLLDTQCMRPAIPS